MSNDIAIQDVTALALRDKMNQRLDERTAQLELADNPGAIIAPTILTVRRLGGVGASLLGAALEYLLKSPMFRIEVGGAACPALKNRAGTDYHHFPSSDPDRVDKALDARLQAGSTPAIIEFEPALYQSTLDIATALKRQVSPSSVVIFYIAGQHDPRPKYETNAVSRGLADIYICRQASQSCEDDPDGLIKLPWLDQSLVSRMMREGLSLVDALKQSERLWTANVTRSNLEAFGTALWRAEQ